MKESKDIKRRQELLFEKNGDSKMKYWKTSLALSILAFLVWLNIGCARVSYQTDKGEKFTYTRLGTQKLNGVEVKAGDKSLKLESSQGSSGDFATAIKNLSERIPVIVP